MNKEKLLTKVDNDFYKLPKNYYENPRIYFAGKVYDLDQGEYDGFYPKNKSFRWDLGLAEGTKHGHIEAGQREGFYNCGPNLEGGHWSELFHDRVVSNCLSQIIESDIIFAYKDSNDCYGTLIELGFAVAHGKHIVLLDNTPNKKGVRGYDEFWFIKKCPQVTVIENEKVEVVFNALLKRIKKTYYKNYQEYLNSEIWQEKKQMVYSRSKGLCEFCKIDGLSVEAKHVHHREYTKWGEEKLTHLVHLCESCHSKIHRLPKAK